MRFIYILFLTIIGSFISCKEKPADKVYLIPHSTIDTAQVETVENGYKIVSWFNDTIYWQCGLEFIVTSNDSSILNDITYEVDGAFFIRYEKNHNQFVLTPFEGNVKLKALKDENSIFSKDFKIIKLPEPVISIKSNGKIIQSINEEDSLIQVSIEQPDERLKRILPKDCRYGFTNITISNDSLNLSFSFEKDRKYNISSLIANPGNSEEIKFTIDSVSRMNFRNKIFLIYPQEELSLDYNR